MGPVYLIAGEDCTAVVSQRPEAGVPLLLEAADGLVEEVALHVATGHAAGGGAVDEDDHDDILPRSHEDYTISLLIVTFIPLPDPTEALPDPWPQDPQDDAGSRRGNSMGGNLGRHVAHSCVILG